MDKLDKYIDGAKEKVQGFMQGNVAAKEIREGITQLEALPEIEGSILYKMDLEDAIRSLSSLYLIITDNRLDNDSVVEEVRKAAEKFQPSAETQAEAAEPSDAQPEADEEPADAQPVKSDEELASENVRAIAFSACLKALDALTAE